MSRDDYYADHADVYDAASEGIPGDVDFYRDLARAARGPVVELGVGTGRVALPIAASGIDVIGIDSAAPMLAIAREKAARAGLADRLHLACGDMRRFALRTSVALVTLPYRTFAHNLEVADQVATLEACHAALAPGGQLALNIFNPALLGEPAEAGESQAGESQPGPTGSRLRLQFRLTDAAGIRRRVVVRVRHIYREEMERLLERCGFRVESLHGDCFGAPFIEHSTEQVWVARRS